MSLIIPNFKDSHDQSLVNLPEVVLAKTFQQAQEPVQLVFLQQSYTLQRDLQITGLQGISYWNAFDDLQHVTERNGLPLTIYDFSIPDGMEPFFNNAGNQILLYQDQDLKMEVQLHNQIEIEKITHFLPDGSFQVDNYDDRGFLSTSMWLNEDRQLHKMKWFTPFHEVVAEMDEQQKIIIDSQYRTLFWQKSYQGINELVGEIYTRKFKWKSVVITAFRSGADSQNRFYLQLPAVRKVALLDQDVSLDKVSNVVTDQQELKWVFPSHYLEKQFLTKEKQREQSFDTVAIEPYPASFNLGNSNEFETKMVYWQFRNQSDKEIIQSLNNVFPMVLEKEKMFLLIDAPDQQRALIESFTKQWIKEFTNIDPDSNDYQRYFEADNTESFNSEAEWLDYLDEHLEDDIEELDQDLLHQFYQVGSFLGRIKLATDKDDIDDIFSKTRLFIDQGNQADLRKQILSISAGVPIISFAPTDLVKQSGNGFQSTTIEQLPEQLIYFLQNLHHWNQSLVDSVSLMEDYETDQLLKRWKGVMTNG